MTGYDGEAARRLALHLDNLLHARVHTLLITEAILFVAAISARTPLREGIALFASVLTLVIAVANINIAHKLRWTMSRWQEAETSGLIRDYAKERSGLPRSITIYTWWIPALLIGGWIGVALI